MDDTDTNVCGSLFLGAVVGFVTIAGIVVGSCALDKVIGVGVAGPNVGVTIGGHGCPWMIDVTVSEFSFALLLVNSDDSIGDCG